MRLSWLAAFNLAFVLHFGIISGHRDEGHEKLVGSEEQDEKARASDPDELVTTDIFNAVRYTFHSRPDTKFEIPNAWVLAYVNPKWSYNKDDWKTWKLNWGIIDTADKWRVEVKKDLETDMSKWNDKIWLLNWLRSNNLKGPEVVWFKYSDSTWHSQQPLRWADATYGQAAPMDEQQTYIAGDFTGIDWLGIIDLNNDYFEKSQALKKKPSELMQKLRQFCDRGINNDGNNKGDFVIKASHLSESQGVFVTKGGKLIKDVRTDFIETIDFPEKKYSQTPETMQNEIRQATRSKVKLVKIFDKFQNLKLLFETFKAGYHICGDNKDLAFVDLAMKFEEMIWVDWESKRSKIIPRGTVIEKIRQKNLEIKIPVGLGNAWGFYYNSVADSMDRLSEEAKNEAYQLAQDAAIKARVDFCRADIILGSEGLIISEFTLVPGLNWITKKPLDAHIKKLQAWHLYDAQVKS
jgi:hypothetical protein